MTRSAAFTDRLKLRYNAASYRRVIAGLEVIVHCHHYNSRVQNTIEQASAVDGKRIISSSAEAVFAKYFDNLVTPSDDDAARWALAQELYAHLGYGQLDVSARTNGIVTATTSHFVEGWNAGFPSRKDPVCTFTEGYLQGVIARITGSPVWVHEEACMISGAPRCSFRVDPARTDALATYDKQHLDFAPGRPDALLHSENVDEEKIIGAVVGMPIHGNDEGLIPAFGVYLANTPADFYNLACIRFVEEMGRAGLASTARSLLVADAETCGMNTFRGIMASAEWEGLIAPMVKNRPDSLFGIMAVSNALGWGNWHVQAHEEGKTLSLVSLNGYEALGFRELRGTTVEPQCLMLTGVSAGIMELIYGTGSIEERFGTFLSSESACISQGRERCELHVEPA